MKKPAIYIGLILSALFLWLALRHANFAEIVAAFENVRWWPLVPMLFCLTCFYFLKAIRWGVLLSPAKEVSGVSLVPSMMAGAAGNNLLPAHLGELIRVYLAGRSFGIAKSTVLGTLVVERVFDLIAVLLIFSVGLLAGDYSRLIVNTSLFLLVVAIVLIGFVIVLLVYNDSLLNLLRTRVGFIGDSLKEKIIEQMQHLHSGLSAVKTPAGFFLLLANSILSWLFMVGCIYAAIFAFDIDVTPLVAMVILGILVAGLSLPTSPGFFGTIEYGYVLGLSTVGIDPSAAISVAIYYHLPAWLVVTLTGIILFRFNKVPLSEVKAATN